MAEKLFDHEGWFLFCPVYFATEDNSVYPKYGLHLVLELAIAIQDVRNYVLSSFDPDLAFFPFVLKEMKEPKKINLPD